MKTIRRFGKVFSVIEKTEKNTSVIYPYTEEEGCEKFYEKFCAILDAFLKSETENTLKCTVSFLSEEYISMLCKTDKTLVGLNYNLKRNIFESDKKVLKREGFKQKEIKSTVKKIDKKLPRHPFAVQRIHDGVALYFNKDNPISLKMRRDTPKK